jgi:hypothetical protein
VKSKEESLGIFGKKAPPLGNGEGQAKGCQPMAKGGTIGGFGKV